MIPTQGMLYQHHIIVLVIVILTCVVEHLHYCAAIQGSGTGLVAEPFFKSAHQVHRHLVKHNLLPAHKAFQCVHGRPVVLLPLRLRLFKPFLRISRKRQASGIPLHRHIPHHIIYIHIVHFKIQFPDPFPVNPYQVLTPLHHGHVLYPAGSRDVLLLHKFVRGDIFHPPVISQAYQDIPSLVRPHLALPYQSLQSNCHIRLLSFFGQTLVKQWSNKFHLLVVI